MTTDARLLRELREAKVHIPPGDLSAALGITRVELDAAIARLADAGFDIEIRPGLGCRLVASPDRLIADDLFARIGGSDLVREILVFEETGSTNDVAARLGRDGHPGGVLVLAEHQTAGRGRFGRRWVSGPREGLWLSLLIRPEIAPEHWARLTTWAGVSLAATVEHSTGLAARLKWPNDVQVAGKKVAGILTECSTDTERSLFAVVGIGLNVNHETMPAELAGRAASLRQLTGLVCDRAAIAAMLVGELADRLPLLDEEFSRILEEAGRRSAILGTWIRLTNSCGVIEGRAESLDQDGALLLRLADGSLRKVTAGEVSSQLPAPGVPGR